MEESTIRKFLRVAISAFLYASIMASACIGVRSIPVDQKAWAILSPYYVLLFFVIVIPTSFYLGYRSTRKHCQCGRDVWMVSFTFIIISTLTLLCVLYIILYKKEVMLPSFRRSTPIPKTVLSLIFSDYKFVLLAPVPFLVGAGTYWLVHGKGKGHGGKTLPKFLRVAGVSFLYTAVVITACMSIRWIPADHETLMTISWIYFYLIYIIVIPASLYLGYRLTKKHCKNFEDVYIVCFIFTVVSILTLLVILCVFDLMYPNFFTGHGPEILKILEGAWNTSFSQFGLAYVLIIPFWVGVGIYWLYHGKENHT